MRGLKVGFFIMCVRVCVCLPIPDRQFRVKVVIFNVIVLRIVTYF